MAGITKIKIPIKASELNEEVLARYLPTIWDTFTLNNLRIRSFYNVYLTCHAIHSKIRPHDDTEVNNIVVEPHINSLVDWKAGYVLGNPIKYAQSEDILLDDIKFLNRFIRDCNKRTVDKDVITWTYATGVGYYFIQPKEGDFDVRSESPFDIYCIEADTCTKVYSSYKGSPPLFDIIYTIDEEIDNYGKVKPIQVASIYTRDYFYEYRMVAGHDNFTLTRKEIRPIYKMLPLVEKALNANRLGIVEIATKLQNALDKIASSSLDNLEESVNEIYAYFNVSLGENADEQKKNHTAMKRNGAVVLNTPSNAKHSADIRQLANKLNFNEIVTLKNDFRRMLYDSVGVPLPSSDTNSGGTTKQGSEVANGYENAYNRALNDVNSFITADNELLKRMLFICHETSENPVDELTASAIEIKYSLNMTDNMLTKSQSYVNFINSGVPPAFALAYAKISSDPESEGKTIEEYREKLLEEENISNTVAQDGENILETKSV